MPRSRPLYPLEFRARIVELARAGRSPEELSRELEPSARGRESLSGRSTIVVPKSLHGALRQEAVEGISLTERIRLSLVVPLRNRLRSSQGPCRSQSAAGQAAFRRSSPPALPADACPGREEERRWQRSPEATQSTER